MDKPLIARVRFELFPGSVSGKTRDYLSGVRPNHRIRELNCDVIGNVDFVDGSCALGQVKEAVITYLYYEPFSRLLKPGYGYDVYEGARLVGHVEILEMQ